jgi:hypothetical protein
MKTTAAAFERNRYVVVREFVTQQLRDVYRHYVGDQIAAGTFGFDDGVAARWFRYKDPLSQALSLASLPAVEEMTGLALLPTYSYTVVYPPGSNLPAHRDRPACEVSASLTLDNREGDQRCGPWGFWLRHGDHEVEVLLDPGDLVLYRGCEMEHFRHALPPGRSNASVLMHFVEANGPHRHLADDAPSHEQRVAEAALEMLQAGGASG